MDRPENTMEAYRYSWNIKGAIPEIDVRTTSDGVMVCIHDNCLRRTTDAPLNIAMKKIQNLDICQILKVDAGIIFNEKYKNEPIPTLQNVFRELQLVKTRQVYLDVKELDLTILKNMIFDYNIKNQIIFVHGNIDYCKRLLKLYKGARTMSWLSGSWSKIINKFIDISNSNFAGLSQIQLHLHSKKVDGKINYLPDKQFLINAVNDTSEKNVNLMVRPFHFNHESISNLLSFGIKWFVIDEPGRFIKTLKEIYT